MVSKFQRIKLAHKKAAKLKASYFGDTRVRKRIYVQTLGIEVFKDFLKLYHLSYNEGEAYCDNFYTAETMDIADLKLENIHVNLFCTVNTPINEVWIPKAPLNLGYVFDYYVAINVNTVEDKAEIAGFITFEQVKKYYSNPQNVEKYIILNSAELMEIETFPQRLLNEFNANQVKEDVDFEEVQFAEELLVPYLDHELTLKQRSFLQQHLYDADTSKENLIYLELLERKIRSIENKADIVNKELYLEQNPDAMLGFSVFEEVHGPEKTISAALEDTSSSQGAFSPPDLISPDESLDNSADTNFTDHAQASLQKEIDYLPESFSEEAFSPVVDIDELSEQRLETSIEDIYPADKAFEMEELPQEASYQEPSIEESATIAENYDDSFYQQAFTTQENLSEEEPLSFDRVYQAETESAFEEIPSIEDFELEETTQEIYSSEEEESISFIPTYEMPFIQEEDVHVEDTSVSPFSAYSFDGEEKEDVYEELPSFHEEEPIQEDQYLPSLEQEEDTLPTYSFDGEEKEGVYEELPSLHEEEPIQEDQYLPSLEQEEDTLSTYSFDGKDEIDREVGFPYLHEEFSSAEDTISTDFSSYQPIVTPEDEGFQAINYAQVDEESEILSTEEVQESVEPGLYVYQENEEEEDLETFLAKRALEQEQVDSPDDYDVEQPEEVSEPLREGISSEVLINPSLLRKIKEKLENDYQEASSVISSGDIPENELSQELKQSLEQENQYPEPGLIPPPEEYSQHQDIPSEQFIYPGAISETSIPSDTEISDVKAFIQDEKETIKAPRQNLFFRKLVGFGIAAVVIFLVGALVVFGGMFAVDKVAKLFKGDEPLIASAQKEAMPVDDTPSVEIIQETSVVAASVSDQVGSVGGVEETRKEEVSEIKEPPIKKNEVKKEVPPPKPPEVKKVEKPKKESLPAKMVAAAPQKLVIQKRAVSPAPVSQASSRVKTSAPAGDLLASLSEKSETLKVAPNPDLLNASVSVASTASISWSNVSSSSLDSSSSGKVSSAVTNAKSELNKDLQQNNISLSNKSSVVLVKINKSKNSVQPQLLSSSGSSKVDNLILKSVKQSFSGQSFGGNGEELEIKLRVSL